MTSHDPVLAPDGLPYVEAGMIWDGIAEYHDGPSPGTTGAYLLRMYGDGTRRFTEFEGTSSPMQRMRARTEQGWEQIGVTFVPPSIRVDGEWVGYKDIGFLNYDGTFTFEPVNQYFHLNPFFEHAARFAHQLDYGLGGHTLTSADERDSEIVRQVIAAMIGVAARRYAQWQIVDPQELIVGGNFDGTLLWKRNEQDYIDTDIALCGQCELTNLARQFKKKGDLAAFRRGWRQGIVHGIDRTASPKWTTTDFAIADIAVEDFYDELDTYYDLMIDHYDEVIGVQDHA